MIAKTDADTIRGLHVRIETLFWSAVVVLAIGVLVYRHVNRRNVNRALGEAREAYAAARAQLIADPLAVSFGPKGGYAVLTVVEAIADGRGAGPPPTFAELSGREMRAVELAHAATILTDRQFNKTLRRLSAKEQTVFRQLRDLMRDETSAPPVRETTLRADTSKRSAAIDESGERQSRPVFDALPIAGILEWLKNTAPRDPDMWHLLPELNWDHSEIHDILLWVVSQEECDASTAVLILHLMQPDVAMDMASGGQRWHAGGEADASVSSEVRLLAMIGKRSEEESFGHHVFAPDRLCTDEGNKALLDMMLSEKERIESAGRRLPFPLPVKLLSKPALVTGRKPKPDFEVHDDRLLVPQP